MFKKQSPPVPLDAQLEVLKALAHPLRLEILKFIHSHSEINVNKIYNSLELEQSITSQHLKIMYEAGIVVRRKIERFVYYSVNYKQLETSLGTILSEFSVSEKV